MRRRIVRYLLLAACLACGNGPPASPGLRILLIGNSLTNDNDLPGILHALLAAGGYPDHAIASLASDGYGLEDHWAFGPSRDEIASGRWDVIVLQQGPSATEGRPSLLEYSRRYAGEAAKVGARVGLYMVWPDTVRFFDFDGVSESYRMAAEQADGLLFPAGEAWRAAWRREPTLPLYGPDGFHPSPVGSYLAALVMFQRLTGASPRGLPGTVETGIGRIEIPAAWLGLLHDAAEEANEEFGR